jgi:hypothetical protein
VAPMVESQVFLVERRPEEVRDEILSKLASMSARVVTVSESYVEAQTGSQLATRLKGGWIARPTELPMRTAVALQTHGQGTQVQVTVTDAMGFGVKLGMRGKYKGALRTMIEEVRQASE